MRRFITLSVIVGVFMAIPGVAFAHECVVINRSEQGNQGSDHGMWFAVDTDDFILLVFGDPETGEPTEEGEAIVEEYGEDFKEAVAAADLPTSFSIFEHHTIGEKPRTGELTAAYDGTGKSSDGKGIEHFFDGGYFDTYAEILFGVISA